MELLECRIRAPGDPIGDGGAASAAAGKAPMAPRRSLNEFTLAGPGAAALLGVGPCRSVCYISPTNLEAMIRQRAAGHHAAKEDNHRLALGCG